MLSHNDFPLFPSHHRGTQQKEKHKFLVFSKKCRDSINTTNLGNLDFCRHPWTTASGPRSQEQITQLIKYRHSHRQDTQVKASVDLLLLLKK